MNVRSVDGLCFFFPHQKAPIKPRTLSSSGNLVSAFTSCVNASRIVKTVFRHADPRRTDMLRAAGYRLRPQFEAMVTGSLMWEELETKKKQIHVDMA